MRFLRYLLIGLLVLFVVMLVRAAQQTINLGTTANDGTGDTIRVAFQKINSNFTELYVTAITNGGGGAGNGIVKSGTNLHFASSSAYTPGLMPYASGTGSMALGNVFYDSATGRLTIGSPVTAGPALLTVGGASGNMDGIYVGSGSIGNGNNLQLYQNSGDSFLAFGKSSGSYSFNLFDTFNQITFLKARGSGIIDLAGNWRFLNVGPGALVRTDSSTNLAAVTIGSGLSFDGTTLSASGSGTVTSVGLTVPAQFSVAGSPVTTSGTLAVSWANQSSNRFLAGPINNGAAAAPTFRLLSISDFNSGTSADATTFWRGDGTWATPGGTEVAPINNFYTTNNFFISGKGNTLIITNAITNLALTANTVVKADANKVLTSIANAAGILSNDGSGGLSFVASGGGSSGGASVWIPNTALTYSGGTNLTIDGSGGTNFYVVLTNTAFFTTPNNIPASKTTNTSFTIYFQQDATGTRAVTWTNASFKFPGGPTASFQPITNANAVSWVTFQMSPFTNGVFIADYGVYDSR